MKEKHTSDIFLRPRFQIEVFVTKDDLLAAFHQKLKENKSDFPHKIIDNHIFIDIPLKDNHFWSPQLHLEILENNDDTIVKGLFGPKPQVWTLFMFLHFVIGLSFFVCCIWAYTNASLNNSVNLPIVFVILLPLVWVLLYILGRLGRETGKSQIKKLQNFTIEILNSF